MRIRFSNRGFSLIETLVVCVIVAILAGVSIPLYASYVTNQRWGTVNQLAETGAAAGNAVYRRTGTALALTSPVTPNTTPLNLYFNASKYKVEILADSIRVTDLANTSIKSSAAYK